MSRVRFGFLRLGLVWLSGVRFGLVVKGFVWMSRDWFGCQGFGLVCSVNLEYGLVKGFKV